jgi:hypothetical protein
MKSNEEQIARLVKKLYRITGELERMFPGRPFPLDGHLVGSLGEVVAARDYGLDLLEPCRKCHDARKGSLFVQIKTTQGGRVGLSGKPQHLIVIRLRRDGTTDEVYNGPGYIPWKKAGQKQKNGQRPITVPTLARLMRDVPSSRSIPKR